MAAEMLFAGGDVGADSVCFNEAAANGRGNVIAVGDDVRAVGASMRPRRMAAEIRRKIP